MKKYIIVAVFSCLCICSWGQAKKPIIMVIPNEGWCYRNNYSMVYDDMGKEQTCADFRNALLKDPDLKDVITNIGILMTDRDYPLKDLDRTLASIKTSNAEDNLTGSKTTGAGAAESPLDIIRRTAKADIILELDWKVEVNGFDQSVTYTLRGLDAYTSKQIAAAQGTGQPSMAAPIAVLLKESVESNMDNFTHQLQKHFDDLFENGREVSVELRRFEDGSDIDFETEFDGYELSEIIDNWMAENTVEHRFSKVEGSENILTFEQVRIPLYRENGMAMDTEHFVRELRRFLSQPPYNIPSKVIPKGLGKCQLIIGEK